MRRSDREITDTAEILKIVEGCDVCRLALAENNLPYIVPMNFGYKYQDEKLTLYFHGASEGRKMELISNNPYAVFEMDCSHKLIESENPCSFTMEFESVIGNGKIHLCHKHEEKVEALNIIMENYVGSRSFSFPKTVVESLAVFKLEVSEFTAKKLKR